MMEWLGNLWDFRGDGDSDLVATLQLHIDLLESELAQLKEQNQQLITQEANKLQEYANQLEAKLALAVEQNKFNLERLQALDVHTDALLNNYFGEEVEVDNMDKMQMQFGLYFLNSGLASQLSAVDLYYFKKAFQQALWKSYQLGARDKAETAAKYPL